VLAPARQITRSASANAWAVSSMKGVSSASHTGLRIRPAACIDLPGTALMHDPRRCASGNQGQRLRHHLVERLGAQAATDHQQPQRSAASGKPLALAPAAA
jgi:hypothetical protein